MGDDGAGFSELFGATSYTMQPTNKQEQERLFGTDNCMLVTNKYQYEGTTGGKSGWTEEAATRWWKPSPAAAEV